MERRDLLVRRRKEGDLRDVEEVDVEEEVDDVADVGDVDEVAVWFRSRSSHSRFEVGVVEVGSSNRNGSSRSIP